MSVQLEFLSAHLDGLHPQPLLDCALCRVEGERDRWANDLYEEQQAHTNAVVERDAALRERDAARKVRDGDADEMQADRDWYKRQRDDALKLAEARGVSLGEMARERDAALAQVAALRDAARALLDAERRARNINLRQTGDAERRLAQVVDALAPLRDDIAEASPIDARWEALDEALAATSKTADEFVARVRAEAIDDCPNCESEHAKAESAYARGLQHGFDDALVRLKERDEFITTKLNPIERDAVAAEARARALLEVIAIVNTSDDFTMAAWRIRALAAKPAEPAPQACATCLGTGQRFVHPSHDPNVYGTYAEPCPDCKPLPKRGGK